MDKKQTIVLVVFAVVVFAGVLVWLLTPSCPDDFTFVSNPTIGSYEDPRDCLASITQNTCKDQNVDHIYQKHADRCRSYCAPCEGKIAYNEKGLIAECIAGDEGMTDLVCKGTKSKCECE
jgi:hypothetical protein